MSESSDSAKEGARSLPFIKREPDKVVSSGQSEGTMKVTASHVRFFRRYLQDIRGKTVDESAKWHEMTETQLVFHMREFFAGIKKQSDGTDLQPSYLWNIFASVSGEDKKKKRTKMDHQGPTIIINYHL